MTARQCYEAILIELNKENAPNILLEDFNYLFNKSINQYINKRYNIYDINQQTTDDLRVLKATALLTPEKCDEYGPQSEIGRMMGATYEVNMPTDYLHILNCICVYDVIKTFKCYNAGDVWRRPATRLTADVYSQVLDNFWLRPTYRRPYYYIHNVNEYVDGQKQSMPHVPTNKIRRKKLEDSIDYVEVNETRQIARETDYEYPTTFDKDGKFTRHIKEYIYEVKVPEGSTQTNSDSTTIGQRYPNYTVTGPTTETINGKVYLKFTVDHGVENLYKSFDGTDAIFEYNDFVNTTDGTASLGQDHFGNAIATGRSVPTSVEINDGIGDTISNVERGAEIRYGNVSNVRMEIRYGTDDTLFRLKKVYIDYIKAPQNIRLTQEQLDLTEDTSQMLEFPDYVCQEIINELVHIVMENITDQRLQTHPVVTQSIANPAQAQTEPVAQSQAQ